MAEDSFRLPTSSYEEIIKIIRAYGVAKSDSTLDDIAQTTAMNRTIVSANNGFLKGIGIIEGGNRKKITNNGAKLALALEHEMENEIHSSWQVIIQDNEFLQKILAAVRIRGGMDQETLQSHIAYSAGQGKGQRTVTGAIAIINIFKAGGLLWEDDGKLVATKEFSSKQSSMAEDVNEYARDQTSGVQTPSSGDIDRSILPQQIRVIPVETSRRGVSVQVQIQCSVSELDELTKKLPQLIEGLSQIENHLQDDSRDEG